MIYNFVDDFCNMKTTVYYYTEDINDKGEIEQKPLARAFKKDYTYKDILISTFNLNWMFNRPNFDMYKYLSKYGKDIKQLTRIARTYPHGSIEYNTIKEHMPGFTWNGYVKTIDDFNEDEQKFYKRRLPRSNNNIILNNVVCIEFDEVEPQNVPELINKAIRSFPHLIYAGRTLSNKLFCIHRADNNLTVQNYVLYYKELAVQYYNELGIRCDEYVKDIARMRFICDQTGSRAQLTYCDFKPSENIEVEYGKIFIETHCGVTRTSKYIPEKDETVYEYDKNKGFYYGHGKQHILKINDLIIYVPSITQIINTLLALDFSREEIVDLWKNKLKYYNYNSGTDNVSDCISLTKKFTIDKDNFKIGQHTYTFLCMFFPDIVGINGFFLAENEFLCDRYYNIIVNAIITYNRILIHGDTGIGKTYFANKFGQEKNIIMIVPYIAHMDNYKTFNYIENTDDIDKLSSGVIIWDRFVKLFKKGAIDEDSIIIIDESHKLFIDQSYRNAAIKMNEIIPKLKNHVCYISATPINEIGVEKTYKFEKERRSVILKHFNIVAENGCNTLMGVKLNAFLHMIYGNINYYDRIFIASDIFAQKIYDRLFGRFDCQLIRANQKNSTEFIELMKTHKLDHKIIIGTCISYESLNFSNENEKILTLTDMNNTTTAEKITQIAGRVRFSKNVVCLLDPAQSFSITDFNTYKEYYDKLEEIKNKYNVYSMHHYIQDNHEILDKIQTWYYNNSEIETIKNKLPRYIQWKDYDISASMLSDKSPLNDQVKKYIIDYLNIHDERFNNVSVAINDIDNNDFIFFGDDDYIKIEEKDQAGMIIREKIHDEQYSYGKLLEYISYNKINDMITKTHTLPQGVNGDILKIIDIIRMDEDKYYNYVNDLELYLKNLTGLYFQMLNRYIKNIKKIRNKYSKCKNNIYDKMYENIFDLYVIERKKIYEKRITIGLKTCTVTEDFTHPEKYNLTVGQQFNSCAELAKHTKKSLTTITQWRQKKWIV